MTTMAYHPTVNKIKTLLQENSCWFETFEHEPVRTSEEAATIRHGYSLSQGAKALILKIKTPVESKFMMFVLPGDKRLDNNKVKEVTGAKNTRFATPEEVVKLTGGVEVGGVPPFGNLFSLEVIVDPTLLTNEKIIFNAGDRRYSIAILANDYVKLVKPAIRSIC